MSVSASNQAISSMANSRTSKMECACLIRWRKTKENSKIPNFHTGISSASNPDSSPSASRALALRRARF